MFGRRARTVGVLVLGLMVGSAAARAEDAEPSVANSHRRSPHKPTNNIEHRRELETARTTINSEAEHGDTEGARASFLLGTALAEQERWQAALEAYERSFAEFPHATTLHNIGYCHLRLGAYLSSWLETSRAVEGTEFPPENRLSPARREVAAKQRQALEARLARLTVLNPPDGLQVTVDEQWLDPTNGLPQPAAKHRDSINIEPGAWSATSVARLNPGPHAIRLCVADQSQTHWVSLNPGEHLSLEWQPTAPATAVPLEAQAPEPPSGSSRTFTSDKQKPLTKGNSNQPGSSALQPGQDTTPAKEPNWREYSTVAAWSTAAAGVATATLMGIIALRISDKLSTRCSGEHTCPESQRERVQRYQNAMMWTNAGLIAGVAGTGVALSLELTSQTQSAAGAIRLRVSLERVQLRGSF